MQITDGTRKILQNEKGELKNHFLTLTDKEAYDPNFNICAGIRWLIYKKGAAERRLGRPVSWREAVADYKGYRKDPKGTGMGVFDEYYDRLKSTRLCCKSPPPKPAKRARWFLNHVSF